MIQPKTIYLISLDDQQVLVAGPTPEAALAYRALNSPHPAPWFMAYIKPFLQKDAEPVQPLAYLRDGLTYDQVADELETIMDSVTQCALMYHCPQCKVGATFDSTEPLCHTCTTKKNIGIMIEELQTYKRQPTRFRVWDGSQDGFFGYVILSPLMAGSMWMVRWQYAMGDMAVESHSVLSGFDQDAAIGRCTEIESEAAQDMYYHLNRSGIWQNRS